MNLILGDWEETNVLIVQKINQEKKNNNINLIMSIRDNNIKISRFLMAYFYVDLMEYY